MVAAKYQKNQVLRLPAYPAYRSLFAPTPIPLIYLGGNQWKTGADVRYTDAELGPFFIPAGYVFDLASVPRCLWWFIAPFEDSILAPLLHDYIYGFKGKMPPPDTRVFTEKDADDLFYRVMLAEGVGKTKAWLSWKAVRTFGFTYWDSTPK